MKHQKEKKLEGHREMPKAKGIFDIWKYLGVAKSHRTDIQGKVAADSMIAVYRDRITYTFILDGEVASIHFDRMRREIFFKGHNIRNMELSPKQVQSLKDLKVALARDERGVSFLSDYNATLGRLLADKI